MIKNLIFLGPPGSGKGSTAVKLNELFGITHISTGEIFRKEIKNNTEIGKKVSSILKSGKYVPDELTNKIIAKKIKKIKDENEFFILDGYPRTINQAKFLSTIISEKNLRVILLDIPPNLLIERLVFRRICPICKTIYHLKYKPSKKGVYCEKHQNEMIRLITRDDDNEKAIYKRMNIYNELTKPIIDFYKQKGILVIVNSEGLIEDVANAVNKKVFND